MWIDSHCHLNHPRNDDAFTADQLIQHAFDNGVSGLVSISCRIHQEYDFLTTISGAHNNVWHTVGTHPHDSADPEEVKITAEEIASLVHRSPKAIGIGETGLDYFYNNSPVDAQKQSFEKHLEACLIADVPVIIHTRDADDDTADILEHYYHQSNGKLRGLLHCFSSGAGLAKRALDIGFYISLSGIVTFKKSEELRAIVKTVPHDRLLVETDAPFLAPAPHRGKTNMPAYVAHTGTYMAEYLGLPAEEFAAITSDNFYRLFTKAAT